MKLAAPFTILFFFIPFFCGWVSLAQEFNASGHEARIGSSPPSAAIMTDAVRPFHSLGVGVTASTGGLGLELATPLMQRVQVRASGSYFSYRTDLLEQGATMKVDMRMRDIAAMLDLFPLNNHLRVSAGVSFVDSSNFNASLNTLIGQSFTLDDVTYTSDPSDPVHGSIAFHFGGNIAPRLTLGYGDMLPKKGRFGISFEAGVLYAPPPTVQLTVEGSGCTGPQNTNCAAIDQNDVRNEQTDLTNDVHPLRFYPVLSLVFSYKIGHTRPK